MPDALGSTRQLTDNSTPVGITDSYTFDAWGGSVASSGTTVNPFRYVGRENYYTDTQISLLLLGVRYYNPSIGRFITMDPIGLRGGDLNLYRYVKDMPVVLTDPRGLYSSGDSVETNDRKKEGLYETWIRIVGGVPCYDHPKSGWCGRASYAMVVGKYNPGLISQSKDYKDWPKDWSYMHYLGKPNFYNLYSDTQQKYVAVKQYKGVGEDIKASLSKGYPVIVFTHGLQSGDHIFVLVGFKKMTRYSPSGEVCKSTTYFYANNSLPKVCHLMTLTIGKTVLTQENLEKHLYGYDRAAFLVK